MLRLGVDEPCNASAWHPSAKLRPCYASPICAMPLQSRTVHCHTFAIRIRSDLCAKAFRCNAPLCLAYASQRLSPANAHTVLLLPCLANLTTAKPLPCALYISSAIRGTAQLCLRFSIAFRGHPFPSHFDTLLTQAGADQSLDMRCHRIACCAKPCLCSASQLYALAT